MKSFKEFLSEAGSIGLGLNPGSINPGISDSDYGRLMDRRNKGAPLKQMEKIVKKVHSKGKQISLPSAIVKQYFSHGTEDVDASQIGNVLYVYDGYSGEDFLFYKKSFVAKTDGYETRYEKRFKPNQKLLDAAAKELKI